MSPVLPRPGQALLQSMVCRHRLCEPPENRGSPAVPGDHRAVGAWLCRAMIAQRSCAPTRFFRWRALRSPGWVYSAPPLSPREETCHAGSLYLRRRAHAARARQTRRCAAPGAADPPRHHGAERPARAPAAGHRQHRRCDPGRGQPGRRAGLEHRPRGGHRRRLCRNGGRRAGQPLLRLGSGSGQHGRRAGHGRPVGPGGRRWRGIHVAHSRCRRPAAPGIPIRRWPSTAITCRRASRPT